MENLAVLQERAINIRKNIVRMVTAARSGHPGGSLSAVEIVETIYFTQINVDENNVDDKRARQSGAVCDIGRKGLYQRGRFNQLP